jgi:hypothetical protein
MTKMENYINANEDKGRDYLVAPKEQAKDVNLSGKRTLVGRNSGECRRIRPPKGTAILGKLSGERTETFF